MDWCQRRTVKYEVIVVLDADGKSAAIQSTRRQSMLVITHLLVQIDANRHVLSSLLCMYIYIYMYMQSVQSIRSMYFHQSNALSIMLSSDLESESLLRVNLSNYLFILQNYHWCNALTTKQSHLIKVCALFCNCIISQRRVATAIAVPLTLRRGVLMSSDFTDSRFLSTIHDC